MNPLNWRVLRDPPLSGPFNISRDHALAETLPPGEGVVRLYQWKSPTLSFGRNEPSRGLYLEKKAADMGVGFVRRPTGGRVVLHHEELTYAVVLPAGSAGGLRWTYRTINEGLLAGLGRLGASAVLADSTGPALPPDSGPCFRVPAEGEVTARGRKLIGSAQVKIGGSILQHGSLILDGDQEVLSMLRKDGEPVPRPATLKAILGIVPSWEELTLALQEGLAHTLKGSWVLGVYRDAELDAARKWKIRYLDPEWTWRV